MNRRSRTTSTNPTLQAPDGDTVDRALGAFGAWGARPDEDQAPWAPPSNLADIRRTERSMILVRWAGVAFALVQVLAYRERLYPPGTKAAALALAGVLAAGNVAVWLTVRRTATLRGARILAYSAFSLDVVAAAGFVWLYAFDPLSALWAVLFIIPLEGAIRFGLPGALASWGLVTALYIGRELWRVEAYPESTTGPGGFGFQPESISFRMGIGFLIALVAGLMSRTLTRQRARLSAALADLSRQDALRARMVAALAHDVRNPLTTIRGTFQTLLRHLDRLGPEVRQELLETGDRQAERLERLASELLDLARMEEGRLELAIEHVPLAHTVRRGLSFADREDRFEVRIDPHLTVRADAARLEEIVVNLATNALRYGEPPFVVEAAHGADGRVELAFRDHGRGVPEAGRQSLFEPFGTEPDGTSVGLGLAIVKALAEAQGGDVTYEPNLPRGACFRVGLVAAGR